MSRQDYYETLGVPRNATESDIKSAYRKLALKHHPDRNHGDAAAEESFKAAAEAYSVLGDAEKRARYDRFGHAGVAGASGAGPGINPDIFGDFSDILGDFFGFGGGSAAAVRRVGPTCASISKSRSKTRLPAPRPRFRFHARNRARPAMAPARRPAPSASSARSAAAPVSSASSRASWWWRPEAPARAPSGRAASGRRFRRR